MLELDEVVRQNQRACLPTAKSGRAEAELFETYPELPSIIERGRQAKLDSIILQSRTRDQDSRYGSVSKGKGINMDESGSSPSTRHSRPGSSKGRSSASKSPLLKARSSTADLIFEMDEGDIANDADALDQSTHVRNVSHPQDAGQNQTPPSNFPNERTLLHSSTMAPALEEPPDLPISKIQLPLIDQLTSDVADSPIEISQTTSRSSKPWGSAPLGSHKLDMKDIMAQASLNRVSNISSGLSHQAHSTALVPESLPKISQRARRKQQHRQPSPPPPEVNRPSDKDELYRVHQAEERPKFAWQMNSLGPKVSLKDVLEADNKNSSPSKPAPPTSTKSPLTLRQTVPGIATQSRANGGDRQQESLLNRSVSFTTPPKLSEDRHSNQHPARVVSASHQPATSPSASFPTPIHSIRHYSRPAEPLLQLSMADILSQQQTEKLVFREASAKRSLQEIQEEQAFQEWWDEESRKVRMEEEAKEVGAGGENGRERGARGRGRGTPRGRGQGRGRGRGRGRGNAIERGAGNGRIRVQNRDGPG